ncbi:MAG TPA: LacI family DNA-binding transcriptional regulator [Bryobacteraceae bacterium]|nr:LacI family DNA-binding transcriptional regulator [Bryobacteraceae bacterium]
MTLEEVARRAGVSTATVSRVLNKAGVVRETTRKRVLQAARELRYHPNLHARTLAGAKSNTLGMIVSNIENPFFIDIFRSLESAALQRGYEVVVEHTDYKSSRLVTCARAMLGRRVAGLAAIVSEMEPSLIEELTESDVPVVFYDVGLPARNITNIRVRYERGMQRTVEYLYSMGHRRMAFVGHHASLGPLQARKKTFIETMARYSGQVQFTAALNTDSPAGGKQAAHELLASDFRPTAVLCVNDFMALGVIRELRDQGFSVPRDISVTGFDNIQLSEFSNPALTTVNIPRRKIGQMAFEALAPKESSGDRPREFVIDPELLVRESTGPPPV